MCLTCVMAKSFYALIARHRGTTSKTLTIINHSLPTIYSPPTPLYNFPSIPFNLPNLFFFLERQSPPTFSLPNTVPSCLPLTPLHPPFNLLPSNFPLTSQRISLALQRHPKPSLLYLPSSHKTPPPTTTNSSPTFLTPTYLPFPQRHFHHTYLPPNVQTFPPLISLIQITYLPRPRVFFFSLPLPSLPLPLSL